MTAYPDGFTSQEYELAQTALERVPRPLREQVLAVRERRLARIVGHAHVALALLALHFASSLRRMPTDTLAAYAGARRGWIHLGWTVLVAATPAVFLLGIPPALVGVPEVFLLGIPPALVAVTGALFVPLAYRRVRGVLLAERRTLETRDHLLEVPLGIVELEAARASLFAAAA